MIKRFLKVAPQPRKRTCKTCSRQAVLAVRQKRQELAQARKAKDRA